MELPGLRRPSSLLGTEQHQMLDLNKRLESYLSRVKLLEEENELLRVEVEGLRAVRSKRVFRQGLDEELRYARQQVEAASKEKDWVELQVGNLGEELQGLEKQRRGEALAREEASRRLGENRKELEEEKRAQLWLREKVEQLEKELLLQAQLHHEDILLLQTHHAHLPPPAPTLTHGGSPVPLQELGMEYSQMTARVWQEAALAQEGQMRRLEQMLAKAQEEEACVRHDRKEAQLKTQALTKELEAQQGRKDVLEKSLIQQRHEQVQELKGLQSHLEMLDRKKEELREQISLLLEDRRSLLQLKMSLGLEVATYRALLDSESLKRLAPSINPPRSPYMFDKMYNNRVVNVRRAATSYAAEANSGEHKKVFTLAHNPPAISPKDTLVRAEIPKPQRSFREETSQVALWSTAHPQGLQHGRIHSGNIKSDNIHKEDSHTEADVAILPIPLIDEQSTAEEHDRATKVESRSHVAEPNETGCADNIQLALGEINNSNAGLREENWPPSHDATQACSDEIAGSCFSLDSTSQLIPEAEAITKYDEIDVLNSTNEFLFSERITSDSDFPLLETRGPQQSAETDSDPRLIINGDGEEHRISNDRRLWLGDEQVSGKYKEQSVDEHEEVLQINKRKQQTSETDKDLVDLFQEKHKCQIVKDEDVLRMDEGKEKQIDGEDVEYVRTEKQCVDEELTENVEKHQVCKDGLMNGDEEEQETDQEPRVDKEEQQWLEEKEQFDKDYEELNVSKQQADENKSVDDYEKEIQDNHGEQLSNTEEHLNKHEVKSHLSEEEHQAVKWEYTNIYNQLSTNKHCVDDDKLANDFEDDLQDNYDKVKLPGDINNEKLSVATDENLDDEKTKQPWTAEDKMQQQIKTDLHPDKHDVEPEIKSDEEHLEINYKYHTSSTDEVLMQDEAKIEERVTEKTYECDFSKPCEDTTELVNDVMKKELSECVEFNHDMKDQQSETLDFEESDTKESQKQEHQNHFVEEDLVYSDDDEKDPSWATGGDPESNDSYALENTVADPRPLIRYKSDEADMNTQASHLGESDFSDNDDERELLAGLWGEGKRACFTSKSTEKMEDLNEEVEEEAGEESTHRGGTECKKEVSSSLTNEDGKSLEKHWKGGMDGEEITRDKTVNMLCNYENNNSKTKDEISSEMENESLYLGKGESGMAVEHLQDDSKSERPQEITSDNSYPSSNLQETYEQPPFHYDISCQILSEPKKSLEFSAQISSMGEADMAPETTEEYEQNTSMITNVDLTDDIHSQEDIARDTESQDFAVNAESDCSYTSEDESPNASQHSQLVTQQGECTEGDNHETVNKIDVKLADGPSTPSSSTPTEEKLQDVSDCRQTEEPDPMQPESQGPPQEWEQPVQLHNRDAPVSPYEIRCNEQWQPFTRDPNNLAKDAETEVQATTNGKFSDIHNLLDTTVKENFWDFSCKTGANYNDQEGGQDEHVKTESTNDAGFGESWQVTSNLLGASEETALKGDHPGPAQQLQSRSLEEAQAQSEDSLDEGDSWSSGDE